MAPVRAPKKAPKPTEKLIAKSKKIKKRNFQSFSIYLYKVLRSVVHQGISKKSILIMNNFVNDMLEKIAVEARRLVVHGKKTTMGIQDIQSAVRLVLPEELAEHANIEGIKALNMCHMTKDSTKS